MSNNINRFSEVFFEEGTFFEVRILNTNQGTVSGYFNNIDKLENAIKKYDGQYNIYFTLNKIDQSIEEGRKNRLVPFVRNTTADKDIISRQWVLIDLDPKRPTGVSSSNQELASAESLADDIVKFLSENGFTSLVRAMSGNGHHILIPVAIQNNQEVTKLIKIFASIGHMFLYE